MAINIDTSNPRALLDAIKKKIDEKHIQTWEYDKDGDFTHSAAQWNKRAWLRPSIGLGSLKLTTLPRANSNVSTELYAIFHGRFIEMLLAHFDNLFTNAGATAMPVPADIVSGSASVR
jgi:hypothetical protein